MITRAEAENLAKLYGAALVVQDMGMADLCNRLLGQYVRAFVDGPERTKQIDHLLVISVTSAQNARARLVGQG